MKIKLYEDDMDIYDVAPGQSLVTFSRDKAEGYEHSSTAYHDRLQQWNYELYRTAINAAHIQDWIYLSVDEAEIFLSTYFDKPCRVNLIEIQKDYAGYEYIRMDYQY